MGKFSRDKGRRGQTAAKALLTSRDWTIAELAAGIDSEDLLAIDPSGTLWCVEVKNTQSLLPTHFKQAQEQAKRRRQRWMLMWKRPRGSWHIYRQGYTDITWSSGEQIEGDDDGSV